jgi:RNA polymerase sigma factor (sigma-70 family)
VDVRRVRWENRAHFLAVSANLMRQILVDVERTRGARKRGGDVAHIELDEAALPAPERGSALVALDAALDALAQIDARKSQVVELRYFGGLSVEETAEVLKVSEKTVRRDWQMARLWLGRELGLSMAPASRRGSCREDGRGVHGLRRAGFDIGTRLQPEPSRLPSSVHSTSRHSFLDPVPPWPRNPRCCEGRRRGQAGPSASPPRDRSPHYHLVSPGATASINA